MMNVDPTQLTNADAGATDGLKCDGSQVYINQILQLYVNGKTLFDFNGIDTDARRLSFLTDSWGSLNIPIFSNVYFSQANISAVASLMGSNVVSNMVSRLGYCGFNVNTKITELNVEHTRTILTGTVLPYFIMYVYGEVVKVISIENGMYTIMYM